ncbi:AGAP010038-PB, partial [Anopheles gambiae str. PEST]
KKSFVSRDVYLKPLRRPCVLVPYGLHEPTFWNHSSHRACDHRLQ